MRTFLSLATSVLAASVVTALLPTAAPAAVTNGALPTKAAVERIYPHATDRFFVSGRRMTLEKADCSGESAVSGTSGRAVFHDRAKGKPPRAAKPNVYVRVVEFRSAARAQKLLDRVKTFAANCDVGSDAFAEFEYYPHRAPALGDDRVGYLALVNFLDGGTSWARLVHVRKGKRIVQVGVLTSTDGPPAEQPANKLARIATRRA